MAASTMTSEGQVTIPKSIREAMSIGPGDRVRFVLHDDGTVLVEPETIDVRSLRGLFAGKARRAVSVEEMDRAMAGAVARANVSRGSED